jgi:DNA adenine methylase
MLKAPFPYFGGKSMVADIVWSRFGNVPNYVEPFFGSGAVLLGRPHEPHIETANDLNGFLANFWRSIKLHPEETAEAADWPVNEVDLHARHAWLVSQRETLTARLMGDPEFCDTKIAGWWVWGLCSWIGSGWCSGKGPWIVEDGILVHSNKKNGINKKLPRLVSGGINRQLPRLGGAGQGISRTEYILDQFQLLHDRLRDVRVCCGDWSRICGPTPTVHNGLTGVFLDPPYSTEAKRRSDLYACDDLFVAFKVREWALANGDNPKMRIALCGYEGEREMPSDWECVAWKAQGGYSGDTGNNRKERIWFSPHCLKTQTINGGLFNA